MDLVIAGLNNAKTFIGKGKPIVILMKTEMGYGIDFMKVTFEWHGVAPNDDQLKVAYAQLPVTLGDY